MEFPGHLKSKSDGEMEEWILSGLSAETIPVDEMVGLFSFLASSGESERLADWVELLQDALVERGDGENLLRVLEFRCTWREENPSLRKMCEKVVYDVFSDRTGRALVRSAGFDAELPLKECLRRLAVLRRLQTGAFCYHKTWGFGIVRRLEELYRRVTIEFQGKPAHRMSFASAAEDLEIIGEDHLLSRKHRNPEEFARLVRSDPSEVVRIALLSYGEMNASVLKEALVADILPESDWKGFWESARKVLKADPLVDFPSGRNQPIRLLDRKKEFDEEWFALLKRQRDPKRILEFAADLERDGNLLAISDEFLDVLEDRLAFVVKGFEGKRPDLTARAVMAANQLGVAARTHGLIDVDGVAESLLTADNFLCAASAVSRREIRKLLQYLATHDVKRTSELLLSLLARMPARVLNESVRFLMLKGKERACADRLRSALNSGRRAVAIMYWLAKHPDEAVSWSVTSMPDLLFRVVGAFQNLYAGEELRTQNELRILFRDKQWLDKVLGLLDSRERKNLLLRISNSDGWDALDRRSVMAKIIGLYPELHKVVISEAQKNERGSGPERLTSWRSYLQRKEAFRKLVEELIPANSREIGAAMSYGDLRENFEYQAAKDRQKLLLRREREMGRDLKDVKGTDFRECPTDKAGTGTSVVISRPDGRVDRYVILGEWDRDEKLGIISGRSRVARIIEGHREGETVLLPSDTGEEACRIVKVSGVSDEVKSWIQGADRVDSR